MIRRIAKVAVEKTSVTFDDLFDYLVPENMDIRPGMRVAVPFGRGSVSRVGMVFSLYDGEESDRLKTIALAVDSEPVIDDEMLRLAEYMREKTFCTYYDAVRTMLPPGLSVFINEKYSFDPLRAELSLSKGELTSGEMELMYLAKETKDEKSLHKLVSEFKNRSAVKGLISKRIISTSELLRQRVGNETEKTVRLIYNPDEESDGGEIKLSPKQKNVIEIISEVGTATVKELCYLSAVTESVIKNLEKKGILEICDTVVSRSVTKDARITASLSDIVFSPLQQKTYDGILSLMGDGKPHCALLHGVTGSGKTSVFIKLIESCEKSGKNAILLVPEIALTPQTVSKFQSLFGNTVAIIHSNLSAGQRADEYKRIRDGQARIVIGTRSAIFAPLKDIGIIVIDEEDEHTYRSDRSPRYHARDIAKQRCFRHNALLLLASATPSFDSYYSAVTGKYSLFEMNERYSKNPLPEVIMVDMRVETEKGNRGSFSEQLLNELRCNLETGEQSMLLLNRRGYHTYANCINCGQVISCPQCGIPLTYHRVNESVICHYCGFRKPMPSRCEKCGSRYIYSSGTGTQRIEDEIHEFFPEARVLRMDADTTMSKYSYERRFKEFANNEYDIMVGTQMIAKGLDFENVTLVGVLLIDRSLYAGDYLGYENTFSLITQVVGRAGRGAKKGRAFLQTFSPDHYVLNLAANQDYKGFYEQENKIRETLIFPPYCDLCSLVMASSDEKNSDCAAETLHGMITERAMELKGKMPMIILGPSRNGRLKGIFRSRIIIKCRNTKAFRGVLREILERAYKLPAFSRVNIYIDFNGVI